LAKIDYFLEGLFHEHKDKLFKIGFYELKNKQTAEELVQDVFCDVADNPGQVSQHPNPKALLFAMLRNKIRNEYRRLDYQNKLINFLRPPQEEQIQSEQQYKDILETYLGSEDAALLYEFYILGYTLTELCELHKIGLSAVKMRLKRARDTLKETMAIIL